MVFMSNNVNPINSNDNIFFTMRANSQPDKDSIGGSGGRKMRLVITQTDITSTSENGFRTGGHHAHQSEEGLYKQTKKVEVAAVLLKDASFWDKVGKFFGFSKVVNLKVDGQNEDVLLNTSSLAKRLGIENTKDLSEEQIKEKSILKLKPLDKADIAAALKMMELLFSHSISSETTYSNSQTPKTTNKAIKRNDDFLFEDFTAKSNKKRDSHKPPSSYI
jgi:hypothetical protein